LVSSKKKLGPSWPGSDLTAAFIRKSGGFFIWVFTTTKYLLYFAKPDKKLRDLLLEDFNSKTGPLIETQMDDLYAEILGTSPWEDSDFSEMYHTVVGTIVAALAPLSPLSIWTLHGEPADLDVEELLEYIRPLLASSESGISPIRLIHLSLTEFLTARAALNQRSAKFAIDRTFHSRGLANLCLSLMVKELNTGVQGIGYLTKVVHDSTEKFQYQPVIDDHFPVSLNVTTSEAVAYACRFWVHHILDIDSPPALLLPLLRQFVASCFVVWLEVVAGIGTIDSLKEFQTWFQVRRFTSPRKRDS
jgi:hypothetical protein